MGAKNVINAHRQNTGRNI